MNEAMTADVAVVGGGPAGLLAALLCARAGASVALIAAPLPSDARTTALLDRSVAALRDAGLWEPLAAAAAPLRKLRVIDGGRRLVRAPEVLFDAAELNLDAFGWNVPNVALAAALREALAAEPTATMIDAAAVASRPGEDDVEIELADGRVVRAALTIAADGKRSLMREAAGLALPLTPRPQTALAFTADHERDHEGVSTEIHFEEGPFTLVPMPGGRRSSVVWVVRPAEAEDLQALSPEAFGEAATQRAGRLLGAMTPVGRIGAFPIAVGAATRLAARRTLLVGEAGHALPPIGAQGLNLGVRDAVAAADQVRRAIAARGDVGGLPTLAGYMRDRAADVWSRTLATEGLNRTLTSGHPSLHALRGAGLAALQAIGPLRRFVMRQGIGGAA
ncbi:FAD-dependent monooxygenase [Methylopila sp. Yamaguchi]|uniref:FAD-dependent monooxygenase n=1 Tax=Methylopila sp. Yamaguchi TaxID=1437817 RepID=UPI000CAA5C9B|nr:FAD-dependent monooxygenase [Methylopila sp. Yamaguchi]GBD47274.1 2-octaprenyl-6-methoxyphenyl hydroxylase [Methylopila sp. Yamaguchi]